MVYDLALSIIIEEKFFKENIDGKSPYAEIYIAKHVSNF